MIRALPDIMAQVRWLKTAHILRRSPGRVQTEATDSSLFLNLMLADLLQAIGNMPSIKWMRDGVRRCLPILETMTSDHLLALVHHERVTMHRSGRHQADWNQRSSFNVSCPSFSRLCFLELIPCRPADRWYAPV